jgi:hypothetical protein
VNPSDIIDGNAYKLTRSTAAYDVRSSFNSTLSRSSSLAPPKDNCTGDVVTVHESRAACRMGSELVSKHLVQNARGHWTWVHNYELETIASEECAP